MERKNLSHSYYRIIVFWVGIVATIAYRAIVILNYYSPLLVEIFWYIGTLGFIWYFAHRYRVEHSRQQMITQDHLSRKIERAEELTARDREEISYILKGVKTGRAKWNYIAIFTFSIIALIIATINNIIRFF
jgi:hypothetical protein